MGRDFLQQRPDGEALRTVSFADPAADAVGGFAVHRRKSPVVNLLVVNVRDVFQPLHVIEQRKVIRNGDFLRTLGDTVAAIGAGDGRICRDCVRRLTQQELFLVPGQDL